MLDNLDFSEKFNQAYHILENSPGNIFFTGEAGTGKSTLLRYFREHTFKKIVVLAPTGVAAVNIKGQTIHSFFKFKPDITVEKVVNIHVPKAKKDLFKKLNTLIIDEISMVRADLLDCIDAFLRLHGRDRESPFGGTQMIFIGDLYQLPPVVTKFDEEIFNGIYKSPYFFDAKSFKELNMQVVELKTVYRQQDSEFIKLLNKIRENQITYKDLEIINKRVASDFVPSNKEIYIYLTTTNEMAERINQNRLDQLKTRQFIFEGEVEGRFEEKNLPTHKLLELRYGAQVMLLNNDPKGRWINGSLGKVMDIVSGEKGDTVQIELENKRVVEVERFTWDMFRFYLNETTGEIDSESIGSFSQYPIKLAWAVTIHKSQGQTFPKVIIDVGKGAFAHGQIYVALSRCTDLDGIVLSTPLSKKDIILDKRIVDFMKQILRNELK